jgi:DNA-binding GntR family transcriptional regulator
MLSQPRAIDPSTPAHERVYRTLRQRIMHGEIGPGEALTIRGIGKNFDVSMTPAREAVRRLVGCGGGVISLVFGACLDP